MSKHFLPMVLAVAVVAWSLGAKGQTPAAALIAEMPATASWRIDYKYKAPPATAPDQAPRKQQVLVSKGDGMRRERIIWSDGKRTEDWTVRGVVFRQDLPSGRYAVIRVQDDPDVAAAQGDFSDLSWISDKFLVGPKDPAGESRRVYAWTERLDPPTFMTGNHTPTPTESGPAQAQENMKAYAAYQAKWAGLAGKPKTPTRVSIDNKTALPIGLENEQYQMTYTFTPDAPVEPLVLPEACQKLLRLMSRR